MHVAFTFLTLSPIAMFDFYEVLRNLDNRFNWGITPLTGGLVNTTIRATQFPRERDRWTDINTAIRLDLSPHSTLIIKHAPPYIAALGPEAPFSQFRQVSTGMTRLRPGI